MCTQYFTHNLVVLGLIETVYIKNVTILNEYEDYFKSNIIKTWLIHLTNK